MVREKSGKSQGILLYSNCGHPECISILMFFFSVLPVFILVKHRRHLGSSGDEGCLDEDDKSTSGYRSGNWNATA